MLGCSCFDHLVESYEGSSADKQDVLSIDLQHFLIRMLTSALRRYGGDSSFYNLKKSLLNALTRNITGYRYVLAFSGDLINFIDVDYALFSCCNIVSCVLYELKQNIFYVFSYITRFGQCRRIGDCKGNLQLLCKSLCQKGFSGSCRSYEKNIRFFQLNVLIEFCILSNSFIVVVNCYRQDFFCAVLADYILIQIILDFLRLRDFFEVFARKNIVLLFDYLFTNLYTIVADINARTSYKLPGGISAFSAEGAGLCSLCFISCHFHLL